MDGRRWKGGRWKGGRRTMDNGRWTADDGRWSPIVRRLSSIVHRLSSFIRRPKPLTVPEELFDAFQAIAAEEGLSPDELLARVFRKAQKQRAAGESLPGRWGTLTARQQQVVFLTCQDLGSQEIADRMGISPATVTVHQRRAMKKLNQRTRFQLKQALDQFDLTEWTIDDGR